MKFSLRNPFFVFGLVLLWRLALLAFTTQPIPANDAFYFDGAMVNWLQHGHYCNPSIVEVFPISGGQVFSAYPPLYQAALLAWMPLFGTSALSAMALHLALFATAGFLTLEILRKFFPAQPNYALAALLFFGITFNDRPEDLAHVFGLTSLLLVMRQISVGNVKGNWRTAAGIALALLLTLYTSVIVGAFYFGAGFLACAMAWWIRREKIVLAPFPMAAAAFIIITVLIAKMEPLWWSGFLENARQARQQSVFAFDFHRPNLLELFKLARSLPVFLLAAVMLPLAFARRRQLAGEPWLFLVLGVFTMGVVLLVAGMTMLAPNYIMYVLFAQILLAAGLIAFTENFFPEGKRWLRVLIFGCVILVSIRAVGMTTWGAACAWKNSYQATHAVLRTELESFVNSDEPVIVSSAFLYSAQEFGVQRPVHSDWYYDRTNESAQSRFDSFTRLRPRKLVLTQFDYYRAFAPLLEQLRQHPELVEIRVRDLAAVRTPDSIPSMQRVVQHISWAPVIVDLKWAD